VLSYKAWLKTFNLDPSILNRDFTLNGVKTKLVGIMPVRFTKRGADLYRPVTLDRADDRSFMFQAKMKPGVTMQQVQSEFSVLQMVLRMGLRLSVIGIVLGLVATSAVTRAIASQLWGVSPHDPATLAGVVVLVMCVGAAACYFPAKRATRVDPMVALRYE
jgi:hypothetical protein